MNKEKFFFRFPSKTNSLTYLKSFLKDEINTIIDVGVHTSTISLMRVFKTQKHILIEPVIQFLDQIKINYKNYDYEFLNIFVSNKEGENEINLKNHRPNSEPGVTLGVTGSKISKGTSSETLEANSTQKIKTKTLDNLCKKYSGGLLVKIDVDGHELDILKVFKTQTEKVSVMVIESLVGSIGKIIKIMNKRGFKLWDICDLCYMRGQLSQVDLIFVNKKFFDNSKYPEITPRSFGHRSSSPGNYFEFNEEQIMDQESNNRLRYISRSAKLK